MPLVLYNLQALHKFTKFYFFAYWRRGIVDSSHSRSGAVSYEMLWLFAKWRCSVSFFLLWTMFISSVGKLCSGDPKAFNGRHRRIFLCLLKSPVKLQVLCFRRYIKIVTVFYRTKSFSRARNVNDKRVLMTNWHLKVSEDFERNTWNVFI